MAHLIGETRADLRYGSGSGGVGLCDGLGQLRADGRRYTVGLHRAGCSLAGTLGGGGRGLLDAVGCVRLPLSLPRPQLFAEGAGGGRPKRVVPLDDAPDRLGRGGGIQRDAGGLGLESVDLGIASVEGLPSLLVQRRHGVPSRLIKLPGCLVLCSSRRPSTSCSATTS